jgi:hypothetical protein
VCVKEIVEERRRESGKKRDENFALLPPCSLLPPPPRFSPLFSTGALYSMSVFKMSMEIVKT